MNQNHIVYQYKLSVDNQKDLIKKAIDEFLLLR